MAASAMTPKLLGRISNEKYQEKDKWKIDDIALGPANELLISGHNLEIPQTFISMHKEDSGKYSNFPEFNQNFDRTLPCEQLVLFLKGSSIIGLKVESALRLVSIEDMGVFRTLWWKRSITCVCFYKGNIYASSSSSAIVSVCNLDSEEKNDIVLSDMRSDCVLDIVVVMEKIYVCTKVAGRALVFSMTGSKKMEFKNAIQTDAMAMSICIHERTEVVFVSWSNFQIQLFSQMSSRCLHAFDMTEELHKIRVTTENILVTLSASKCIVNLYDGAEAIKLGEFQNTLLSSVKKKHRKKFMSNDGEHLECHPADFENLSFPRKSASKQSKVEKLRDTNLLYMKQLEDNENLRRKYNSDITKLRSKNTTLEKKLQDVEEKLQLQEMKTENAMHRFRINETKLSKQRSTNKTLQRKVQDMKTEKAMHKQKKRRQESSKRPQKFQSKVSSENYESHDSGTTSCAENSDNEKEIPSHPTENYESHDSGTTSCAENSDNEKEIPSRKKSSDNLSHAAKVRLIERLKRRNVKEMPNEKQTYRRVVSFQSSEVITKNGGRIEIKGTDVSLLVPPGALLEDCEIHIQIITGNLDTEDDVTFASNSAAIVELTPDNFEFQTAVELQLPHCLQLKENFTNESVEVFTSHHDTQAQPHWKRETEVKFELQKETCKIYLKKFCWVTMRVNNDQVEAKRLKIFTAGDKLMDTDCKLIVHVGYFADLPGNEHIFNEGNITIGQSKLFWFQKQGNFPLDIFLQAITPKLWSYQTNGMCKKISYQDIASSKKRSCDFVLRCKKSVRRSGVPYTTFTVYQQHDSTSISFRPKMWNDLSEDEDSQ